MFLSLYTHTQTHTQAVFPNLRDPQSSLLQSLIPAASVFSVPPSSPSPAASEQWPTNPRGQLLHTGMHGSLTTTLHACLFEETFSPAILG